jgi:tetratricopeptide (TPR) repeat protein
MNRSTKFATVAALMVALMAAVVGVEAERERRYPSETDQGDALYVTSGAVVRRLSLAYAPLAADLYWIRSLQYYGGTKRKLASEPAALTPPPALAADPAVEYPLLYPFLDLTTTLDPRFNVAYRFGSVFLAEPFPNGPGRPDLAVALLEKGLKERPDKWEYMQDIGFVYYWYRRDYRAAAAWFDKASRVSGAPWWLKSLAATTLAEGGDRRSSRQMWTAIRESAEVDWLRQDAERRLLQLRALDELDGLEAKLSDFFKRTGRRATTWPALVRSGVVPGVMADPSGTPYQLTEDGAIQMSRSSPLWPLPTGPEAGRPAS